MRLSSSYAALLPLDRCGRFRGDVVDYAVDPLTLLMMSFETLARTRREGAPSRPSCRPWRSRRAGPRNSRRCVRRPSRRRSSPGQDRSGLPYLVVQPGGAQRVDVNLVHVFAGSRPSRGDVAQNADRKTRTREGMAADQLLGDAQRTPPRGAPRPLNSAQRLDDLSGSSSREGRRRCGAT